MLLLILLILAFLALGGGYLVSNVLYWFLVIIAIIFVVNAVGSRR